METKVVDSIEKIENENALVYDIDHGVELVENFNRKSTRFEKEFKKLSKKQKGTDPNYQKKIVLKFVKNNLLPIWKNEVESKFWTAGEMDYLDNDVIYTYIFGAFVTGHSKGLQQHMRTAFANVLKEMTDRAIAAKENLDYQELRRKQIEENYKNLTPEQKAIIEKNLS